MSLDLKSGRFPQPESAGPLKQLQYHTRLNTHLLADYSPRSHELHRSRTFGRWQLPAHASPPPTCAQGFRKPLTPGQCRSAIKTSVFCASHTVAYVDARGNVWPEGL